MKSQLTKNLLGLIAALLFVLILGWIDWQTGFEFNFFLFYFIPISITAWFLGIESSFFISIMCSLAWAVADKSSGHIYSSSLYFYWNTLIRFISFILTAWSVNRINFLFHSEKNKTADLQKALSEIKILESFLSICSVCKKIRNEDGNWQQMESYISNHTDTKFSHSYCTECAKKAMAEAGLIKK
ncbi:MAG: hypothetical protein MUP71_00075 [Candidatus Aminicenantes bacterium]|nr:hypothetical protein [Candidatus Aminicenantes bacterium]